VETNFPLIKPQTKAEEKPAGVWSEQIYQYLHRTTFLATLLAKKILSNPENLPNEVVYQKQHNSMHVVLVRPHSRYPRALREPRSTLFQPQLHPPIGRYTSVYIRQPADESDVIFLWTTEP
jgi:hypothetical protein